MDKLPAWFGKEDSAALRDFFTVYEEHYQAILDETMRLALAHPIFGPMARAMPDEMRESQTRRSRENLRRAVEGDWTDYITDLRAQGATYAHMGLDFAAWYDLIGSYQRFLVPLLIDRYRNEPSRLAGALTAMQRMLDRTMIILGQEYLAEKERIIGAQERATQASLAQTRFLDSIIDNLPSMVFVKDAAELRFVAFNRVGEELLGLDRQNVIGKTDRELFPPEQAEFFIAKDREVLAKKEKLFIPEEPIQTARGLRYLHTWKIPIIDDEGKARYLLGISLDVTEAKEARQQVIELNRRLEEQNQELQRVSRAKTDFLAMMSHELRTPLNSIIGFSEVLIDEKFGALNERQGRYLRNVLESGRHLLGLINDLLDLSKIEAGRLEVVAQPCAAETLASEAVATLRPLAEARRVGVTVQPGTATVRADAARFKQVLYNLLSNAIKFTPAGGQVRVCCAPSPVPGFIRTTVSDTGSGISPEDVQRLFTPFTQLGNAKGHGGTGLGLALTRQLTELMGGSLGVDSQVGAGSAFWVDLPRHEPVVARAAPPAPDVSAAPLALIVDDEPASRELLSLLLHESGYRTLAVGSGEEAIGEARRLSPQVVTLDVFLPSIDGWDVLRLLKSDPATSEIPVVMVSISSDRAKAFGLGALEHLVKPVGKEALLAALERRSFTRTARLRRLNVLAIDDDPAQLELFRVTLEPYGFAVRGESSGREGLAAALAGGVDLVLLDLVMPDLTGIEVISALRADARTRGLPILLVTAHALSAAERARLNGDVMAVISKGRTSMQDLVHEIGRVLREQ